MDQVAWRAPVALVETDERELIVSANRMFLTWASTTEADVIGRTVPHTLGADHGEFLLALRATDDATPMTLVRNGGAGPRRVTLSNTQLVEGRRVISLTGADHFVSPADELRAEAVSSLESARLAVLLRAAVSFSNATSDEQLSELLVEVLTSVFGAAHASVHLHRDGHFVSTAGRNPLVENWPPAMPPPGTHTMRSASVQVMQSPEEAAALLPGVGMDTAMRASGVGAVLVAPIIEQGSPFGAVGCYFSEPRTLDEQAERLIVGVAQQSAAVFARLRVERELRRSAMLDEITGLPNRRLFESQLERRGGWQESLALVFVDLDGFKQVNDSLGHAVGDELLAEVGRRLRVVQRTQDAVCRFGGDEFVAYFEEVDIVAARAIAERIRVALSEPYDLLPDGLRITASVGVAVAGGAGVSSIDQLIREADAAMYEAKRAGGDTVLAR